MTTSTRPASTAAGRRKTTCACGHPEPTHHALKCLVVGCHCARFSPPQKRNKYNAVRCVGPLGELYDSKAELTYMRELCRKRAVRDIRDWTWAPRFVLQDDPLISYRPDFFVWGHNGQWVVDVKGHAARDFSLRVRLWKARYPNVPLCVVKNGVEEWP